MKKTYKILLCSLSISASFAQTSSLLLDTEVSKLPTWEEHLHYQINQSKDTLYIAVGKQVEEFLYQEDHYTSDGLWQGVDRFVWQGENQLRVYRYDGSESRINLKDNRLFEHNQLCASGESISTTYDWNLSQLNRITTRKGDSLKETVFIYRDQDAKLLKVKLYVNGIQTKTLKLSYNKLGHLQKEELYAKDQLIGLATYAYNDSLLNNVLVMDLSSKGQQLKETLHFSFWDNGDYQIETLYYTGSPNNALKSSLCTFDSAGRLLRKEIKYVDNQDLEKEIYLYRYPQEEPTDFEVLSLQALGR